MVGVTLVTHQAVASDIPTLGVNLCTLHYSKVAYGKAVKEVIAHKGMLRDCSKFDGTEPYWTDVKDIPLEGFQEFAHFGTKAIILDHGSTYEPCHTQPIVQYWVTFEDGSQKIEEPTKIELKSWYFVGTATESLLAEQSISQFACLDPKDIKTTACIDISSYGEIALDLVKSYAPQLPLTNH
jgi:hypothetical protein